MVCASSEALDVQSHNEAVQSDLNKNKPPIEGNSHKPPIDKPEAKKPKPESNEFFSWNRIGYWDSDSHDDKAKLLKLAKVEETYVLEHFYADWYWNCSLIVGTCFFGWLVGRMGFGLLGLGLVLLFTNSVYRTEFRRFNRNIRDDMTRVKSQNRLEEELETMEWLNSFMDKFWVIYMPAFSEMVMFHANEVLKDQAPGFGIEALSLEEFTLGSKAPRVSSIKSYTKKGADHVEMDWAFSFTPNDTDGMTKKEIKKKINPKVALGVTVGKAFISKSLPILVEDMSFTGRINIKMKLSQNFPHVKMVSVQFLEAPTIDYALKPVGGDTLGLDIMSFIPGLSKFVNSLIHANLRPMMYAPNSLDVDVEALLAAQSNDSTGVLAVTIKRCRGLKIGNPTAPDSLFPYVQLGLSGNADLCETTKVKKLVNDPIFCETKYLLVNQLENNHLQLGVFNHVKDRAEDQLIGNVDFPLAEMLQSSHQVGIEKKLTEGGKVVGRIEFDVRWYAEVPPIELDDGTKEQVTDSETGILKLNLHEARGLDISRSAIGVLNPYAEMYINYEHVKTCRTLRQTNDPSWEQTVETLITQKAATRVQVYVKEAVDNRLVAQLDVNLQDLVFESSRGQQWMRGSDGAQFRITAGWKALRMQDDSGVHNFTPAPIGGLRLHIRGAQGLKNLESVGKVDPYVRVLVDGKIQGRTPTIADTLDPHWERNFYLPVANEHQHYLLEVMDEEEGAKDRSLGTAAVAVNEFLKKDEQGYYQAYDGSDEIIEQPVILDSRQHGTMTFSVVFVPSVPVFTNEQLLYRDVYEASLVEAQQKEQEQREREEQLYKEHPDDYEWVTIDRDELPTPPRREIAADQLLQYKAGLMSVTVESAHFEGSGMVLHTLFDDHMYPCGISARSDGRVLEEPSTGCAFVRDLSHSQLVFRVSPKMEVTREKDIIVEKTFSTVDVLRRAKTKSVVLKIDARNWVKVQVDFVPIEAVLAPMDTVLDVGVVRLDILNADNLPSVDSNGKSDPFVVLRLDGVEVYKTDKKRRTLNPVWNEEVEFPVASRSTDVLLVEVYDWDLTHSDELLGRARLDLTEIEPNNSTPFSVQLDTQGVVHLRATFKPQFIRPKLGLSGFSIDLSSVSAVPLKAVTNVGDVAGNVVGTTVGTAADTVKKGTSFFKLKKRRRSREQKEQEQLEQLGGLQPGEESSEEPSSADNLDGGESLAPSNTDHSRSGKFHKNSSPVVGIPNINVDELPPPQRPNAAGSVRMGHIGSPNGAPSFMGHSRSASAVTDVSSFAPSTHGSDAVAGRVTVVSADGFEGPLVVKVVLKTSREKELYRTRAAKGKWNESVPFRAAQSGELVFVVKEHHKFGRDVEVGRGVVRLEEVVGRKEDVEVDVGGKTLLVNIRYDV